MKRLVLVSSAVLALSLVTGCGKIREKLAERAAEKAMEKSSSGGVKISGGGSQITVNDKSGGTTTVGAGAKLPDGWPSDVPAYPDAAITASMGTPVNKTAMFETKDPSAKVIEFYKGKLGSFQKVSEVDLGGTHQLVYRDGKRNIQVVTTPSHDKTAISLSVSGL